MAKEAYSNYIITDGDNLKNLFLTFHLLFIIEKEKLLLKLVCKETYLLLRESDLSRE